jgi:hypothetical protein
MRRHLRRNRLAVLVVVLLCAGLAARVLRRAPLRAAPRKAAPPNGHPVIPPAPGVRPAPPGCQAGDLRAAAAAVRQLARTATECLAPAAARALSARIDLIEATASGCLARDAALDPQWNLMQRAVLELRACADCAGGGGRAARDRSCGRISEVLAAAEKGVP